MKRKCVMLSGVIVAIAISTALLIGCYSDDEPIADIEVNLEEYEDDLIYSSMLEGEFNFSSWQECLDYFIKGTGAEWLERQNITLVNYKLLKDNVMLNTQDLDISDNSIFPIYEDSAEINKFTLVPFEQIRETSEGTTVVNYSSLKQELLSSYIGKTLSFVELEWEYAQKRYTTKCVVSPTFVVYDDFLYNIRELCLEQTTFMPIKKCLTRSEPTGDHSIEYAFTSSEATWHVMGKCVARASCSMYAIGTEKNGVKYLDRYDASYQTSAKTGFKAIAEIKVTDKKIGENGFCEFSYGIAAGPGGIKITWNGNSASFSGGGNTYGGSSYISASMLD